ncbi:MAG: haloalkane dehalogenase, partial [Thermoleophilaceae bacterium]|nr:haloalkane dehalogenase [Thermoleophilaceae bacterium]
MTGSLNGDFAGTFPYESRFVSAGDVSLHYVDEGPPEAAPLLFVHGNPTWSYLWRRQIAELSSKGHRCVAFDHMGFGRSDKPRQLSAYSLERHVANALALIDALDLRDVTLIAHDWGGPIGLGAVLERGDRLRRIVLMNTWAWELPSFLPPFLREFRTEGLGEILALGGNLFVESIPGGMHRRDTDPVMMEAYRAPFPDYWSRMPHTSSTGTSTSG